MRQVRYQEDTRPNREEYRSEFPRGQLNDPDSNRYSFPNREAWDGDDPRESWAEPQFRGRRPVIQTDTNILTKEPVYNRYPRVTAREDQFQSTNGVYIL